MSRVPCASAALWLVLVPAVLSQTTQSVCTTSKHPEEKLIRTVFHGFGQEVDVPKDPCHQRLCHAGLPSSANWTFFGFGLIFANVQTAERVEGCHVQCLQQHVNTSGSATSSTMRNLYAVSCKDNPEVYQCLGACLYELCNISLSGPDAADECSSGLTGIDQLCNSSIFSSNGSSYTGPSFRHNITQLSGSFIETTESSLKEPKSAHQVMARRYGLMTFDLSKVLANSSLTTGLEGVVWQLTSEDKETTTFVPQHAVYRYFKDHLPEAVDHSYFTVPELQCSKFTVTFRMLNATHQTEWSGRSLPLCLIGRLYPDPPTELTLCFYNETNQVPGLEVAFYLKQRPDHSNVEGYGVTISGHTKRLGSNAFLEEACKQLTENSTTIHKEQVPGSGNAVIEVKGAEVPWEILWGCFDTVEVKYFSLPTPSKDTGVEPRHLALVFDVPGEQANGIFYPPYSSEGTHRVLPINVTGEHNDTCSVDAVVTYSLNVSNASAVFLKELTVDLSAATNLPPVHISKDLTTVMSKALNDTLVRSYPSPDGLVVTVQQLARGIHLDGVTEVQADVTFEYNRISRKYSAMANIDLRDRIPPGSTPLPAENITLVVSTLIGENMEIEFVWESPGTPCYPVHQYLIAISSPEVEDHYSETFETNASLSGALVRYTLRTSSYRAEYYNLTVTAVFGKESNQTDPATLTFTLDIGETTDPGLPPHVIGIIGGVAGAVLVAALLCLIIAMAVGCWYRRRNARAVIGKDTVVWIGGDTDSEGEFVFDPSNIDMNTFAPLDEWEIPPHEIIMDQKIADGNFGEVYKSSMVAAAVQNSPAGIKPGALVAVKMLKYDASDELKGEFLREIAIMKKVSQNHCPFVVNMVGCCTMQEPVCLVLEYVAHGSLLNYLRTMRKKVQLEGGVRVGSCDKLASQDNLKPTEPAELEDAYWELGDLRPSHLISFAYQIACGMDYLASMHIIHRDLACRNILVDSDKMLKIADFGLSREGDTYVSHSYGQMPLRWMAIECIRERAFTSKSDVWAFGVTLWELCTLGGYPYPTHSNKEILETLMAGYRLEKPKNCTQDIYNVMLKCWDEDRQLRPTFADLRSQFDQMLSSKHKENYIHLLVDEEMPYYNLLPVHGRGSKESLPSLGHSPTPDPPAVPTGRPACGGEEGRDVLAKPEPSPQWTGL